MMKITAYSVIEASKRASYALIVPAIGVLFWYSLTRQASSHSVFLPTPKAVLDQFSKVFNQGGLFENIGESLARVSAGFALAAVTGVFLGLLLGRKRFLYRLSAPTLSGVAQVSPFALMPLFSFWFGLNESGKVFFVFFTALFPILLNTIEGVRNVPEKQLELAALYKLSRFNRLRLIVLPAALPSIFAGLHLGVFFAWLGTVGAEYFFATAPGLGNIIVRGRTSSQMSLVLVGVLLIGLTGYLLNALLQAAERRVFAYRK